MGRTTPTFRNMIEVIDSSCKGFSRGLRGRERDAWNRLLDRARKHASAGSYLAMDPPLAMVVCMLLEHEMELMDIKGAFGDAGKGSCRLDEFTGPVPDAQVAGDRAVTVTVAGDGAASDRSGADAKVMVKTETAN